MSQGKGSKDKMLELGDASYGKYIFKSPFQTKNQTKPKKSITRQSSFPLQSPFPEGNKTTNLFCKSGFCQVLSLRKACAPAMPSNPDFPHSSGQRGKGRAASSVGVRIGKVLHGIWCFAVKGWDKNSAIKEQKRMRKKFIPS